MTITYDKVLIPHLATMLYLADTNHQFTNVVRRAMSLTDFSGDEKITVINDLFAAFDTLAPVGTFFGSPSGIISEYGFYPA